MWGTRGVGTSNLEVGEGDERGDEDEISGDVCLKKRCPSSDKSSPITFI